MDTARITIAEQFVTSCIIIIFYAITARSLRNLRSGKTAKQERTLLKFGIVNSAIIIPGIFFQVFCKICVAQFISFQVLLSFQIFPIQWMTVIFYLYGPLIDVKGLPHCELYSNQIVLQFSLLP